MSSNLNEIVNCPNKNPKLDVSIEQLREYKNRLRELYSYILKPFKPLWGEEKITKEELIEDIHLILDKLKNIKQYLLKKNKCLRNCKNNLSDDFNQNFIIEHFKNMHNIEEFIDLEDKHFRKLNSNKDKIFYLDRIIMETMDKINLIDNIFYIYTYEKKIFAV